MSWSPLSTEVHNTSQYSSRTRSVAGVVLHHGATTSAQQIIDMEVSGSRQVSSHQVVKDKRNAGIVQEQFRAWSLSDSYWDSWAFTVECANESTAGWTISNESHETLAQLVANWASRYGFWPQRTGDPRNWTVYGHREIYTIHGGSYATACPGGMNLDWITARAQQILTPVPENKKDETMPTLYQVVAGGKYTGNSRLLGSTGKQIEFPTDSNEYKALKAVLEADNPGDSAYATNLDLASKLFAQVAPTAGAPTPEQIKAIADQVVAAIDVPTASENGAAARAAIVKP